MKILCNFPALLGLKKVLRMCHLTAYCNFSFWVSLCLPCRGGQEESFELQSLTHTSFLNLSYIMKTGVFSELVRCISSHEIGNEQLKRFGYGMPNYVKQKNHTMKFQPAAIGWTWVVRFCEDLCVFKNLINHVIPCTNYIS